MLMIIEGNIYVITYHVICKAATYHKGIIQHPSSWGCYVNTYLYHRMKHSIHSIV